MRIVSDFKDYYDVGMGLGQDQTLLYNRFKKTVKVPHLPFPEFYNSVRYSSYNDPAKSVSVKTFIVGFCGRIYPVLLLNLGTHIWNSSSHASVRGYGHKEARHHQKFCFNVEEVDQYIKANFKESLYEGFHVKGWQGKSDWPHGQRYFDFQNFFEPKDISGKVIKWGESTEAHKEYFEPDRNPVFIAQSVRPTKKGGPQGEIVQNACLKDVEFYRKFDTFQAFQEISMWLGNQAEPRKPIPEMSDDIKIGARGFNKWSFRKPPKVKKS